jgi:flagellar biosynthetic protein FlhB
MAEQNDESEKEFDPTPKRLEDMRKKGEIPRSTDMTTFAAYGGFLLGGLLFGGGALAALAQVLAGSLEAAAASQTWWLNGQSGPVWSAFFLRIFALLAPLFGLPAGIVLLALFAQQSVLFAPSRLAPKLSRISPLAGLKQKLSAAALVEFLKSSAKLAIYSIVLVIFLSRRFGDISASAFVPGRLIAREFATLGLDLLLMACLVAGAIGIADLFWQRTDFLRRNRMTRKEVMDEHKDAEGDPHTKQRRRQKGVSIALNKMLAEVPKADVVIVNPTHFAVALKWDRQAGTAPVCVAKGVDEVAHRIREMAMENGVPVRSDPPTARALYAEVEIGEEIRADHYRAVAAAIRFAEALRKKARR